MRNVVLSMLLGSGLCACSLPPASKYDLGGDFVNVGAARFAVFTDGIDARAVRVGIQGVVPEDNSGVDAIELATGCPVEVQSISQVFRVLSAEIDCSRATPVFLSGQISDRVVRSRDRPDVTKRLSEAIQAADHGFAE